MSGDEEPEICAFPSVLSESGGLFMVFEMWSVGHFLYMLSPFVIFALLYIFAIRGKSERVRDTVSLILGILSLLILTVRNADIFLRSGWDLEIIPLQVCHVGNIVTGFALLLKKRWLLITSFCFNMMPAFLAMIFADSLANYDTLLAIRPQSYIWGHIVIVVIALWGIAAYRPIPTRGDVVLSLSLISGILVAAIVCNSALRLIDGWAPNYFYLYDYKGTPLRFLYDPFPTLNIGWFSINPVYVAVLVAVFIALYFALLYLVKLYGGHAKKPN